jgi:hypothetical protein
VRTRASCDRNIRTVFNRQLIPLATGCRPGLHVHLPVLVLVLVSAYAYASTFHVDLHRLLQESGPRYIW